MKQYSKQLSIKQKRLSARQRRRIRQRLRRKQRRMKVPTYSTSMTTQMATDALDMLHISTDIHAEPFEFIQRYELTRQQALKMSISQQPIICFNEHKNNHVFSTTTNKLDNCTNEDYDSTYA
ncbi:unnamed protein product [Adineta steineri]|uniref:Uncharacterized protein n=1 Tax=Adineta steineri TaxID=433720 RepID=A0A814L094_9BILA|nr:unnamed protein product [Adineta steineri]CAF1057727.1 unnamed protein product [Adineta steineri]